MHAHCEGTKSPKYLVQIDVYSSIRYSEDTRGRGGNRHPTFFFRVPGRGGILKPSLFLKTTFFQFVQKSHHSDQSFSLFFVYPRVFACYCNNNTTASSSKIRRMWYQITIGQHGTDTTTAMQATSGYLDHSHVSVFYFCRPCLALMSSDNKGRVASFFQGKKTPQ